MANKISDIMPYWRHGNYLYYDNNIKRLKAKHGLTGYAVYCFLMERTGYTLNEALLLDEETKLLLIDDLGITLENFNEIFSDMLRYELFDSKLYKKSQRVSNASIEESKRLCKKEREYDRIKKQKQIPGGKIANSLGENANFLYKENNIKENNSIVKDSIVLNKHADDEFDDANDEIIIENNDNESISLNIGNFLLHTKGELYELSARASNTDYNNKALRNLIDKLYDTNRFILAKSIEYCLNLDSEDINMHFLHKTFNDFLDMEND